MIPPHTKAASLVEALPYIQKFRGSTFVIKYGGAAMEDDAHVESLLRDVVFLEAVGINPVLVHGGGKAITAGMKAEGLQARFVNGLRVTCEKTIRIVSEVLDRQINPRIVEAIFRFGGRAHGLSGTSVFLARRLPAQTDESGKPADVGFVGEVSAIHARHVLEAVTEEVVPVISPLGAAEDGQILNINADVAAAALAADLRAEKLIYVSDVPGILRDPSDPTYLLPAVAAGEVDMLIARKVLAGGMIPKVRSAANALEAGVGKVHFLGGTTPHGLLLEIFTDAGIGTEITP
jgi:acetylglutamate kinase